MAPPSYCYTALQSSRHIRLLRLFSGDGGSTISGELLQTSIDEQPKYEALSYVWGDQRDQDTISCNGRLMSVGKALSNALHRLRQCNSDRMLWIDAICIDQSSIPDKNTQLPLMRLIYQQAEKVLVWLGPETEVGASQTVRSMITALIHVRNAHVCIQELYEEDRKQEPLTSWTENFRQTIEQELAERTSKKVTRHGLILNEKEDRCGLPGFGSSKWKSVNAVYTASWFFRVWTVQEMVVARQVEIIFGDQSCDWTLFYHAASCMKDSLAPISPARWAHAIWLDSQCRDFRKRGHLALLGLLNDCTFREATDRRDKVYALLGLVANQEEIYQDGSLLKPDYGLTADEVYYRLAVYFLVVQREPNILRAAYPTAKSSSLPSWVPDWDGARPRPIISDVMSWYRAGGDIEPTKYQNVSLHPSDSKTLQIEVKLYDDVTVVGMAMGVERSDHNLNEDDASRSVKGYGEIAAQVQCWREWQALARLDENVPHPVTGEHRESAYWRTLIGDCKESFSEPADSSSRYNYKQWRNHMRRAREGFFTVPKPEMWKELPEWAGQEPPDQETLSVCHGLNNDPYFRSFYNANLRAAGWLCFAVTRKGHFALLPPTVSTGDFICVVPGVNTPLLMRKNVRSPENQFKLLGPCYVHGIMNGEAMRPEYDVGTTSILIV